MQQCCIKNVKKNEVVKKHNCKNRNSRIDCFFVCGFVTQRVEPSYKLPKNYKVSEMNFTLSGLCPQCS
ncbi:hypothetical protein B6N25_05445 [Sphingobacteriales bacterium TSM_CSS]|nr:hypothetical protein B6N25_05445 [Sphingobacteriales bacterium TSM_CSS]